MGNRAIIAFEDDVTVQPFAVYLHWNGGPESIWAFLEVLNKRMDGRGSDICYASARLVEIIGRYFGGNTSLGLHGFESDEIDKLNARETDHNLSCGDNGIYIVGWNGKRYAVIAHYLDRAWLTADELRNEEGEARAHEYWKPTNDKGEPKPTIVEQATYRAGYPGKKTKKWTGRGYDFSPYDFDDEKLMKDILKAREAKPRRRKAA